MMVLDKFNALILTNYWILSFSQFYFVSGVKPHCKGDPLKLGEFSRKEDVGLVRDVCVDIIARNLYNELNYPVSSLCDKLANVRTSTCFCGCIKWKRSSSRTKEVTNQIMTMAEALIENFIEVISKDESFNSGNRELIFERINDAKDLLVNSGVATKDSKIINDLDDLKQYFIPSIDQLCPVDLYQYQKAYQKSIGRTDTMTMEKLDNLLWNNDLVCAVKQFITDFQTEEKVKILDLHIEDNVVNRFTLSGIIRLKFNYRKCKLTMAKTTILKIPSLSPSYGKYPKNLYAREAHFYEVILPALYKLGQCEPFSAKFYTATQARALVLEDLSVEGYESYKLQSGFMDLNHCKKTLNVLAKYHALSYTYLRSLNSDDSSNSLIGSDPPELRKATRVNDFNAILEEIKQSLGESFLYYKIKSAKDNILADLPTKNHKNKNSMNVIIHGDLRSENILFKYDTYGNVCQAKLIDWQLSREATPVLDLIDFFVTNISVEVIEANEDDLLSSYLDTLNDNLSSLLTNRMYSRSELDADMEFFKYHYFKMVSVIPRNVMNPKFPQTTPFLSNITKWVLYLERKQFI